MSTRESASFVWFQGVNVAPRPLARHFNRTACRPSARPKQATRWKISAQLQGTPGQDARVTGKTRGPPRKTKPKANDTHPPDFFLSSSDQRPLPAFQREQNLLIFQPATITHQSSIAPDHPMARNNNGAPIAHWKSFLGAECREGFAIRASETRSPPGPAADRILSTRLRSKGVTFV